MLTTTIVYLIVASLLFLAHSYGELKDLVFMGFIGVFLLLYFIAHLLFIEL